MEDGGGFQALEWAETYDILHEDYKDDINFYVSEAAAAGGPVLEVACGTGRLLLPMLERGIDVEGLDISEPMLNRLLEKAKSKGLVPQVHLADMRTFRLERKFALIIVALESFLLMPDADSQLQALESFRHHLLDGGRLILDFSYPNSRHFLAHNGEKMLVGEFRQSGSGRKIRCYQVVYHRQVEQQQVVEVIWEVLDYTGEVLSMFTVPLHIRFIYKAEFELLLRLAGFGRYEVFGGFNHEPLTREDQKMVWVVRK